jgi:hypothetical protein
MFEKALTTFYYKYMTHSKFMEIRVEGFKFSVCNSTVALYGNEFAIKFVIHFGRALIEILLSTVSIVLV